MPNADEHQMNNTAVAMKTFPEWLSHSRRCFPFLNAVAQQSAIS
jgi:hypothetical protein